jgi:pheromone receptor transcription factor
MEPAMQEVEGGSGPAATVSPKPRRSSQGKQRIKICYIDNKDRRQVTFSKRRKGLFKKASELAQLCGASVAVVTFSERSKPFAIGSPSVDDVLRAYAPLPGDEGPWLIQDDDACRAAVEAALRQAEETKARVAAEQARMIAIGKKVMQAMAGVRFWWEADVEQLGEAELPEFAVALQRLRANVQRHADNLSSAAAVVAVALRIKPYTKRGVVLIR